MKPLTHGFDPSCTTPNGPEDRRDEQSEAGEQHDDPEAEDHRLHRRCRAAPPDCRLRKYDIVIGIIGKTQGVKIEARPKPKATSRKAPSPWCRRPRRRRRPAGGGRLGFGVAGGNGDAAAAAGSTVRVAVPDHRDGTHCVSLQVW